MHTCCKMLQLKTSMEHEKMVLSGDDKGMMPAAALHWHNALALLIAGELVLAHQQTQASIT